MLLGAATWTARASESGPNRDGLGESCRWLDHAAWGRRRQGGAFRGSIDEGELGVSEPGRAGLGVGVMASPLWPSSELVASLAPHRGLCLVERAGQGKTALGIAGRVGVAGRDAVPADSAWS